MLKNIFGMTLIASGMYSCFNYSVLLGILLFIIGIVISNSSDAGGWLPFDSDSDGDSGGGD